MRVGWRIWRRRLIAIALLAVALVCGYWFWFRDSSFVSVNEVEVRGATVNQRAIAKALDKAGRQMTTLHVEEAVLAQVLGRFPTVAAISTSTDFPHGLTVVIRERPPVAIAAVSGKPTGISADGYALIGLDVSRFDLPTMSAVSEVGSDGLVDDHAKAEAAILGGAPPPLKPGLVSAAWDETYGGVVVDLSGAPQLRFGDGHDVDAKWASASALLADPELGSPAYLDVSAPGRPVAGPRSASVFAPPQVQIEGLENQSKSDISSEPSSPAIRDLQGKCVDRLNPKAQLTVQKQGPQTL